MRGRVSVTHDISRASKSVLQRPEWIKLFRRGIRRVESQEESHE